jgi:hypothetical protein
MTCSWLGYIDNANFAEHLLVLVHAGWLHGMCTVACPTSGGIDSGLDTDIVINLSRHLSFHYSRPTCIQVKGLPS